MDVSCSPENTGARLLPPRTRRLTQQSQSASAERNPTGDLFLLPIQTTADIRAWHGQGLVAMTICRIPRADHDLPTMPGEPSLQLSAATLHD
jgi:hypothetical protein